MKNIGIIIAIIILASLAYFLSSAFTTNGDNSESEQSLSDSVSKSEAASRESANKVDSKNLENENPQAEPGRIKNASDDNREAATKDKATDKESGIEEGLDSSALSFSEQLVDKSGALVHKKVNKVINDNQQFRELMREVQNPITAEDYEVYEKVFDVLSQQNELANYAYNVGCSNGLCAIEVASVTEEDPNALYELLREKTNLKSFTYELSNRTENSADIRVIFGVLKQL